MIAESGIRELVRPSTSNSSTCVGLSAPLKPVHRCSLQCQLRSPAARTPWSGRRKVDLVRGRPQRQHVIIRMRSGKIDTEVARVMTNSPPGPPRMPRLHGVNAESRERRLRLCRCGRSGGDRHRIVRGQARCHPAPGGRRARCVVSATCSPAGPCLPMPWPSALLDSCTILASKTIADSWWAAHTGWSPIAALAGKLRSAKRQRVISLCGAGLGRVDVSRFDICASCVELRLIPNQASISILVVGCQSCERGCLERALWVHCLLWADHHRYRDSGRCG